MLVRYLLWADAAVFLADAECIEPLASLGCWLQVNVTRSHLADAASAWTYSNSHMSDIDEQHRDDSNSCDEDLLQTAFLLQMAMQDRSRSFLLSPESLRSES